MFKLLLMRHAKSDWSQQLVDSKRPLNARGNHDAYKVGQYLHTLSTTPDRVLCSSAVRTRETLEQLSLSLSIENHEVYYKKELYLANLNILRNNILENIEDEKVLLVLAHNPGIDDLVEYLSGSRLVRTNSGKLMTTASIAYFEFDTVNVLSTANSARLVNLIRPKEIPV